jgi:type I restriction enzyme S subunit
MIKNEYPKYNPSNVEWIGDIPEHWSITKIKYTSDGSRNSFIDGDWIESKDMSDDGIRYITSGNIGEGKYKEQGSGFITEDTFVNLNCTELFEGDLIISRLFLPVGRSCILPQLNKRVITCVDNVILRPKTDINKHFLNYQFNSKRYSEFTELISRGATLIRISRGMLGNISIVLPPLQEQLQIVHFLDEKTELIDKLISTKERKIDLLKQQRTSLINEVITKGLNSKEKMKDSGVEWIGKIPENWEVKKLKYCLRLISEKGETSTNDIKISPENVENDTGNCFNLYSDYTGEGMKFIKGDILLNKLRIYLKKILFTNYEGFSMGEMIVLRTIQGYNKYFYYTFFIQGLIDLLNNQSTGVKLPRVSPEIIMNTEIVFPPIEEQIEIVDFIDTRTKEIDDLVSLEQKKIELLKEYRQSLISEVITGKIDVTNNLN